jgi:hypothetical protein
MQSFLGDIESGVRQLIRSRPLEVTEVELPSGQKLRVPTPEETLRIKATWSSGGTRSGTTLTWLL